MTIYLVDANVLITAKNEYYEFGRVNSYWEWLLHHAQQGSMKIPFEVMEEMTSGSDELALWARANRQALTLDEEVDGALLQRVLGEGYAPDLTDVEVESLRADPFLIAYALADRGERTVVTLEKRSGKIRQNRKIPSVCDDLGASTCTPWEFGRNLDFRTS